jgi:hypothetical protein
MASALTGDVAIALAMAIAATMASAGGRIRGATLSVANNVATRATTTCPMATAKSHAHR